MLSLLELIVMNKMNKLLFKKALLCFAILAIFGCHPEVKKADFHIDEISNIKPIDGVVGAIDTNDPEMSRKADLNTEVTFEDKTDPSNSVELRAWYVDDVDMQNNEAKFTHTFNEVGIHRVKLIINKAIEVTKAVYISGGNPVVDITSPAPVEPSVTTERNNQPDNQQTKKDISSGNPPPTPPVTPTATKLNISPLNSQVSETGGKVEIMVDANTEWIPPAMTAPWIMATKTGNKLILNCQANSGTIERSSYIEISAGDRKGIVRIVQTAAKVEIINPKEIKARGMISLANCNDDSYIQNTTSFEVTPKVAIILKKIYINTSNNGDVLVKIGNKETSVYVNKGKSPIQLDDDDIEQILEPNKTYKISIIGHNGVKFSTCSMSDANNGEISIKSNNLSVYNLSYSYKKN
jgi:hypothetical protein